MPLSSARADELTGKTRARRNRGSDKGDRARDFPSCLLLETTWRALFLAKLGEGG